MRSRKENIEKLEMKLNIESLKEYLYELYVNQAKTSREISQTIYGIKTNTSIVLKYLHYFNIPIRHGSEAVKTQYIGEKAEVRREISSKVANTILKSKESRNKLKEVMQTDEYKEKQKQVHLGNKNGMYGVIGENHPQWNINRTNKQRIIERKTLQNSRWRISIFERDKYICQCCGYDKGNILVAHHINSYDKYIKGRYDINNGITLCEKCHKKFHHLYGYGNNDSDQFKEWIKKVQAS